MTSFLEAGENELSNHAMHTTLYMMKNKLFSEDTE